MTIPFEFEAPTAAQMQDRIEAGSPEFPWLVSETDGASRATPTRAGIASGQHTSGRWTCPSMWRRKVGRTESGRALYTALLGILADLGYYTALRASLCRTRAAWHCTRRWAFVPSASMRNVVYSSGPGTTWAGGSGAAERLESGAAALHAELSESEAWRRRLLAGEEPGHAAIG